MSSNPKKEVWPPRDARSFIRSEQFSNRLGELALQVSDEYGMPGAFATVYDWLERKADSNFLRRFKTQEGFDRYLIGALRRQARRATRRWQHNQHLEFPSSLDPSHTADPGASVDEIVEHRELEVALRKAIDQLPEEDLRLLRLMIQSSSFRHAAKTAGLPESSFRVRIHRIIEHLQNRLKEFY